MNYEPLIENIMQIYTSEAYGNDVADGKKEFCKYAGVFDEEDPSFEHKMAQFVDWFVFSRPLTQVRKTPVSYVLSDSNVNIADDQRPFYKNISAHQHSLFEFLKIKNSDVHLRDLFSQYKFVVKNSNVTIGFEKDSLFEARLIPHEDSFVFTKSFCLHPPEAYKFIQKEVKVIRKVQDPDQQKRDKEVLIMRLFRMKYGIEFYKHLRLEDIYSNESRLGL